MKKETSKRNSEYLTVLLRRRSAAAFCCGIITLILAFYAIIAGVIKTVEVMHANGFTSFVYYTMISNTFGAISMAFVFPYTVEGMRKKRFTVPKWVAVMHYVVTASITVTMLFVLAFMSWAAPDGAFGGVNILTHVFCPLLILISFFQIESGHLFTWKDRLLSVIPFSVYSVVYLVEVFVIGETNGGWRDIYHVKDYISPFLAFPLLLLLAFGVCISVALLANRLTKERNKKMFAFWSGDHDPVEARIEAYGLGTMAGRLSEDNEIHIPYDILTYLAKSCDTDLESLIRPFVKGFLIERDYRDRSQ